MSVAKIVETCRQEVNIIAKYLNYGTFVWNYSCYNEVNVIINFTYSQLSIRLSVDRFSRLGWQRNIRCRSGASMLRIVGGRRRLVHAPRCDHHVAGSQSSPTEACCSSPQAGE